MKKRGKKKFDLKEQYSKSWDYIKKSKNFIYAISIIFVLFIVIGFFVTAPEILIEKILAFIEELLGKTKDMSWGQLTSFIFLNNIQSGFFGMLFGIFFGIFSVFSVIANGYLLGFVASLTVEREGIFILWRLIPHGIFELPALILSMALGLKLGSFIFRKEKIESLKNYLENALRVFFLVIVPLLFFAAIIETTLIFLIG